MSKPNVAGAASGTEARLSGLGPMPYPGGAAFRVWAPNAEAVSVVGTFNNWNADSNPLERDEAGCWYGDVRAAKPGDEYRYRITYRGESFTRVDPRARALTDSKGNAVIHDPAFDWDDENFSPAPIETLVLYELHVGTFNAIGQAGTLRTAAERLGYLCDLGVNGVTLMPVTEFVGERGWGYDMAHLYAVESSYGGPRALKEFVKAAHRLGIAVFLDLVYNHFGFEDNLLWRFDGWRERDRGGIYFFQDDERADTPWGARPDFSRPEVREYVLDNVRMWLDEYRVDGLRIDGTFHMRTASKTERGEGPHLKEGWSLLREMTDVIREEFPHSILIAEDMRGDPLLTRPVKEGGAGFQCQWSDKFTKTARMSLDPVDRAAVMNVIRDALVLSYDADPFRRIIFSESHDTAGKDGRIPAVAVPDDPEGAEAARRSALALAVVFLAPGIPQLFQGQEVLDPRRFDIRNPHPLDFRRVERFAGVWRFVGDLIALRKNAAGTTIGLTGPHIEIVQADGAMGILAWRRWRMDRPSEDVLIVANFTGDPQSNVPIGVSAPGLWRVRLDSESPRYGRDLGATRCDDMIAVERPQDGRPYQIRATVGPWGFVVFTQDPPGAPPVPQPSKSKNSAHRRARATGKP